MLNFFSNKSCPWTSENSREISPSKVCKSFVTFECVSNFKSTIKNCTIIFPGKYMHERLRKKLQKHSSLKRNLFINQERRKTYTHTLFASTSFPNLGGDYFKRGSERRSEYCSPLRELQNHFSRQYNIQYSPFCYFSWWEEKGRLRGIDRLIEIFSRTIPLNTSSYKSTYIFNTFDLILVNAISRLWITSFISQLLK